jgi:triosephosphate isomerase
MRRPLIAGNWKMNGTRAAIAPLVEGIKRGLAVEGKAEVVLCPPYVFLDSVERALRGTGIALGAQNLCAEPVGAYTGEVSGPMLTDYNCRFVIVGHSERRALYGEDDDLVVRKFARALAVGLTPILCVGESWEEREAGRTEAVIARQLRAVLEQTGADSFKGSVIAYEPVWAIGTGKTAAPEQAQAVHAFIRSSIARTDAGLAENLRILYGGSVKAANAAGLFAMADIDGGLIGGASLDCGEFLAICRAA